MAQIERTGEVDMTSRFNPRNRKVSGRLGEGGNYGLRGYERIVLAGHNQRGNSEAAQSWRYTFVLVVVFDTPITEAGNHGERVSLAA